MTPDPVGAAVLIQAHIVQAEKASASADGILHALIAIAHSQAELASIARERLQMARAAHAASRERDDLAGKVFEQLRNVMPFPFPPFPIGTGEGDTTTGMSEAEIDELLQNLHATDPDRADGAT